MGFQRTYTMACIRLLVCLLVCAYFSGPTFALRQEVEDFEFADTESEVVKTVVKRSVLTDDEDFLMDEPGSGPDDGYEGSGTEEPPVITTTTEEPFQRVFRVNLNLSNEIFTPDLGDRNSAAFKRLAEIVKRALEELFKDVDGEQLISILSFRKGSVVATIDIASLGGDKLESIEKILLEAVKTGNLAGLAVSPDGFRIEALDAEVQCPDFVGRVPSYLPRSGGNSASLLVNNAFPCEGRVIGWEYFRVIPQGSAYVGVWRQQSDSEFVLVRKTELPPAQIGVRSVPVTSPIQVEQGDFIGIFYPRSTPNNVIASTTEDDGIVESRELYQNYLTEIYDDQIQEGVPIDLNTVTLSTLNSTFALRALMDYDSSGSGPDVRPFTCAADQFTCDDGFCIKAEYKCDNQNDCNDGSDEVGCPNGPETCLEGRTRCDDGTCINRGLKCNGVEDCPDGSDEKRCPECSVDDFTCDDGECVPFFVRCNQERNCADGSDERNCPQFECNDNEFRCSDGVCISSSEVCNDIVDCIDGGDEVGCAINITGPTDEVRLRERVILRCYVPGNPASVQWFKLGRNLTELSRDQRSRFQIRDFPRVDPYESQLFIADIQSADAGDYTCRVSDIRFATFNLQVEQG